MTQDLLRIEELGVAYDGEDGPVAAVRDVSLRLARGRALGIVGESGSGKSSVASAILGLLDRSARTGGRVVFEGADLAELSARERRALLGRRIGAVFQDPFTTLNPALRVGWQIAEPMVWHLRIPRAEAMQRAVSLLADMGVRQAGDVARAYPHQLSGGMKQRALIAAALACDPSLLVLDEPTTALDVTVEAQILELLAGLRRTRRLSLLLISHNLRVVGRLCDDVAVMYAGELVETGAAAQVLHDPAHPYTKGLMASQPKLAPAARGDRLPSIPGRMRPPGAAPEGCVFALRCPFSQPRCTAEVQPMLAAGPDRAVRCWRHAAIGAWPPPAARPPAPDAERMGGEALVEAVELRKSFARPSLIRRLTGRAGPAPDPAVDGVTLSLAAGEVLGLVGESGCGKSTLGRLILDLAAPDSGRMRFAGADVGGMDRDALHGFRRSAQLVFQNTGSALNPRRTVGDAVERPLVLFGSAPPDERRRRVAELLDMVHLPASYAARFPDQLSGGERQRVSIARALACEPRFIVCDEPVSALDVSVQAAVVNLLADLRDAFGLAYLFISHDLAVVARIADRIAVMQRGRICEIGPTADILRAPQHPYTRALLASAADEGAYGAAAAA